MPQFHQQLDAKQVMNNAAALMNDPALTDYTYVTMLPYLNMAIFELNESLAEYNIAVTNRTSVPLHVHKGDYAITNLPIDLIELQEVAERPVQPKNYTIGIQNNQDNTPFVSLPRKEFTEILPPSNSLLFWCWQNQRVLFNPNGANQPLEVQLKYVATAFSKAEDETSLIGSSSSVTYLAYKTAALLAMFVGENETRAAILNGEAESALERIVGISNKGKQQMMTRHRPFRAGYKTRGY